MYISRWIPASSQTAAAWETWKEMEDTFTGLKYKSCEGLETQGEPKVYIEEYAESSVPRVHITDKVKSNSINLELVFVDTPAHGTTSAVSRFEAYRAFLAYITGYRFKFKDSERNIIRDMYLSGEVGLSESEFKGKTYIVAKIPCQSYNTAGLT